MWEPTADDLKELLALYREAGDEPGLEPDQSPPRKSKRTNGKTVKARAPNAGPSTNFKLSTNSSPSKNSRAPQNGAALKKAARQDPPREQPSKVIFGRQLRDLSDIQDYEIPPEYRIDPARLHVDSLAVERLFDVKERAVEWLWPGRIPLGRLTLLAGDPGVGKSLVALDIAARVSRGTPWPDSPRVRREPAAVIVFSMEDNLHDTIKPRLIQAGADGRQTFVAEGVYNRPPFIELKYKRRFRISDDIRSLRQFIKETWPVRLVILDPITAYCGTGDGVATSVVHSMLSPLLDVANDFGVAVLCTTHLRPGGGGKAVYQAAGHLSFTTAARAVWGLVRQPPDPKRRLLVPVKMNLATDVEGLELRLEEKSRVVWQPEPVVISAEQALETDRDRTKIEKAMIWLREVLAAEPRLAREIHQEAKDRGISQSTLQRAATQLKVKIGRKGFSGKHFSTWSLDMPDTVDAGPP